MSEPRRYESYVWVTWITGLLSGDKSCRYAAWYRAHYKFSKRMDPDEGSLRRWTAEHAATVSRRTVQLREQGWDVRMEDQAKFNVRGRAATVGFKLDILATRGGEGRVEDVKTGRRRDSDWWQVALYLSLVPLAQPELASLAWTGAVIYADGSERPVDSRDAKNGWAVAADLIRSVGQDASLPATPSYRECRYCDIAACGYRVVDDDERSGATDDF